MSNNLRVFIYNNLYFAQMQAEHKSEIRILKSETNPNIK
jgi:hypothetical protein